MSYKKVIELAKKFADSQSARNLNLSERAVAKNFLSALKEVYLYHEDESYALRDLGCTQVYLRPFNDLFDTILDSTRFSLVGTEEDQVTQLLKQCAKIIDYISKKSRMIALLNIALKRFAAGNTTPVEMKLKLDAPEREGNTLQIISLDRLLGVFNEYKDYFMPYITLSDHEQLGNPIIPTPPVPASAPSSGTDLATVPPPRKSNPVEVPTVPPPARMPNLDD